MKTQVPFDTYPVNAAVDPSGCFAMKLKERQIVNDDSVFEEVVKEKTLPMSPELLEFGFRCVLSTMAERVSKDCRPRKVSNIIKAAPYLRGKLKSAYSAFDKNTCSCAIVFTSLSGLEKSVNTEKYIQFVNAKTGTHIIIDRITHEGCVDSSQIATIMRGKGIAVTGLNLQWLEGDTCTLVWKDADDVEQSAEIVPTTSTVTEMHFQWPSALNAAPANSKVEMRFKTRGGIADGEPQANNKTVTLIEGISPEVAGVQCGENEPNVVWFEDGKLTITGEHLEGVSQVMLEADFNGTTEVCDITENIATKTATQIATGDNGFENTSEKTDMQWTGKSAKLVLVRDGARFEHAVQFKN